jgi:Mrp family chromosome partitioning ATPase
MQHLMEKLNEAFDLVVYKIPSLLEVADPYLVATHTDGVLLVAALGKLKRSLLEKALDELRLSGTPVLGVAINRNKDTVTRRAVTTSATNKELV